MNWPVTLDGVLAAIATAEGGYVDNPNDSGGPTNFGITLATLSDWRRKPCTAADVRALSLAEAKMIYRENYVDGPHFGSIANPRILYVVADTAVLFGPDRATRMLQTALGIGADGVCGPKTTAAADASKDPRGVINAIAVQRVMAHARRVTVDASQAVFLVGWLARATAFVT